MKGGIFYGLRAKQLSLFLIAVVCATILIWAWEKTPILTSLLPPQNHVWQMFPDEVQHKLVPKGENNSEQADESTDLVAPVYSTNTSYFVNGNAKQNTAAVRGENRETSASFIEESDTEQVSKRNSSSKQADLVAPISSLSTDSSARGDNNLATRVKNEETSEFVKEESDIKQVSERKNSSKEAVLDLVAPMSSLSSKSLARGDNNLMIPVKNQACNYGKGKWVNADNWPLYSGSGCKQWLSGMWACRLTQRTDFAYEKLRWQPKDCEMDDFTGSKFLIRMQNKTLAFVGDSLGRQQFQSLMCMITAGEWRPDVLDVGREYGLVKPRGAVRPDGWAYRFPSTNTTILYYWSASLCDIEPLDPTNPATEFAMHLDRPPAFLRRFLPQFDVLVLNTGHHWNRGKINANRWVMHVGGVPNTNRKIADIGGAKNFTIYSIVDWVNSQLPNYPGLKAFYRSLSPRHFFNGDWNTGGTCDNTTPLSGGKEVLQDESVDPLAAGSVQGKKVKILDITALSQLRDEGHISRYSIKATPGMQDCLHWCLPGVPDTWNEILFAQI